MRATRIRVRIRPWPSKPPVSHRSTSAARRHAGIAITRPRGVTRAAAVAKLDAEAARRRVASRRRARPAKPPVVDSCGGASTISARTRAGRDVGDRAAGRGETRFCRAAIEAGRAELLNAVRSDAPAVVARRGRDRQAVPRLGPPKRLTAEAVKAEQVASLRRATPCWVRRSMRWTWSCWTDQSRALRSATVAGAVRFLAWLTS